MLFCIEVSVDLYTEPTKCTPLNYIQIVIFDTKMLFTNQRTQFLEPTAGIDPPKQREDLMVHMLYLQATTAGFIFR